MSNYKTCYGPECEVKIHHMHAFCKGCMGKVPAGLRSKFYRAYRHGAPGEYTEAVKLVRAALHKALKDKKEKDMVRGKSNLVEVTLERRRDSDSGLATAFFQGDFKDDEYGNPREVWIWLPKSIIEVEETDQEGVVIVTLPENRALEKGLI